MFENYTDCLLNNKNVYRSQQRFKSHNMMLIPKKLIRLR